MFPRLENRTPGLHGHRDAFKKNGQLIWELEKDLKRWLRNEQALGNLEPVVTAAGVTRRENWYLDQLTIASLDQLFSLADIDNPLISGPVGPIF